MAPFLLVGNWKIFVGPDSMRCLFFGWLDPEDCCFPCGVPSKPQKMGLPPEKKKTSHQKNGQSAYEVGGFRLLVAVQSSQAPLWQTFLHKGPREQLARHGLSSPRLLGLSQTPLRQKRKQEQRKWVARLKFGTSHPFHLEPDVPGLDHVPFIGTVRFSTFRFQVSPTSSAGSPARTQRPIRATMRQKAGVQTTCPSPPGTCSPACSFCSTRARASVTTASCV